MIAAVRLQYRLQFAVRVEQADGYGNVAGAWEPQFEAHCGLTYLKGSETVLASRLEARSPVIIAMRNSANARRVTHEWQATDLRTGRVFQIKEAPRPSDDRSTLEVLAEAGVAA